MDAKVFPIFFWIILIAVWLVLLGIIFFAGVLARPAYSSEAANYFGQDFLTRASSYSRVKLLAYVIDRVLFAAYGFLLFFLGWKYLGRNPSIGMGRAMAYIAIFLVFLYVITFPVSYWRSFLIERQYGFTTQPFGLWFIDYLKGFMVSFTIAFVGLSGLYALIRYVPKYWWIYAFVMAAVLLLLGTILYPLIVAPLFYHFQPLDDPSMEQEIKNMAEDAGIQVKTVLVADASRRTNKANAYFTGLGRTRRIVLYDNLVNHFSREKIMAVVAHEMGHWKMGHIFQWFLISSAAFFVFIFGLSRFGPRVGADGFRTILAIFLIYALLSVIVLPVENAISRRFEREADQISLQLTDDPDYNIQLFVSIAQANYSNVEPNPWIQYILYSHPPIMERIRHAQQHQ